MTLTVASEWSFLRRKADAGAATPGEIERLHVLEKRMIDQAVAAAKPQIDAIARQQRIAAERAKRAAAARPSGQQRR